MAKQLRQCTNPCGEIVLGDSQPVMPWVQIQLMQSLRAKHGLPPYSDEELDKIKTTLDIEYAKATGGQHG